MIDISLPMELSQFPIPSHRQERAVEKKTEQRASSVISQDKCQNRAE